MSAKNYFEKMKETFKKLPYEFNVTQLHFDMSGKKPYLDDCGSYDVRAKNSAGLNSETVYDVIKTIGPYGLNIKNFTNISIYFDEEDKTYTGKLWIPTKLFKTLDDDDEVFLLENFSLKRTKKIKEDISNLEDLL